MLSDRIHPMVLKELRQGLKSRGFVVSLQGLQLLLVLSMMIYGMNLPQPGRPHHGDLEFANQIYWMFISLVLLVFFPVRAAFSLSSERRGGNLELIQLTRLRSTGIVTGKWLSLALQTLLTVSTLLPYLVARYFFGNLNLAFDLQLLLILTVLSLALSAGAVGLSSIEGRWTRHVLQWPLAGVFGLITLILFDEVGTSAWFSTPVIIIILLYALGFLFFSLHFGGAQIGTGEVNHALPKRLTALVLPVGLGIIALAGGVDTDYILLLAYFFSGIMMVDALAEPPPEEFTIRPRCRIPLLRPGCRSATLFLFLLGAVFGVCETWLDTVFHPWLMPWTFVNLLLFPVAIQSFFRSKPSARLLQQVCIHFVCLGLSIFSLSLPRNLRAYQLEPPQSAILPMLNFMHFIDDGGSMDFEDFLYSFLMTSVLLGCILLNHRRHCRRAAKERA